MRVEPGGHLGDERIVVGVDDAEARSAGIVAGSKVVVLVARVEPDLIRATHIEDRLQDSAGLRAEDDRSRRVGATDKHPKTRTGRQTEGRGYTLGEPDRDRWAAPSDT